MKTKSIALKLYLLLLSMLCSPLIGQEASLIKWQGGAADRIYASPVVIGDMVYFGSNDGRLHCKGLVDGRSYFQYQTGNLITSIPLAYKDDIILVSGNDLLCFDPETISEKWRFQTNASSELAKIDQWDYHHSSPILHEGVVYFGCGNGKLYAINPDTGEEVISWESVDQAPIRTTPNIVDGILYFGDWEGVVYAVDLESTQLKWSARTYTGPHFDNYAGILSQIEVGENLVYYGARNQNIKALNKTNGATVWSFTSPDGGWISGDPILYEEYLLIGGSDNHKFLCFNAASGQLLWEYDFPGNCFSRPIIVEDKVVFTTGNAYANTGEDFGRGFIHVLNLPDGNLYYEHEFPGNVFSSPILYHGTVYVGCDNSNMYALDGSVLLGIETSSIGLIDLPSASGSVKNFKNYPNPFDSKTIFDIELAEPGDVKILITDIMGRSIKSLILPGLLAGNNEFEWNDLSSLETSANKQILFAHVFHNGSPCGTIQMIRQYQ